MAVNEIKYLDPRVVSKLKNIEVKARLIVEGFITGLHRSPYHGFSVEFAEHRPYNPGEPLRNVDWKVFGKTDRLFTKKYEEETNLRMYILLDTSDSMRYPQKVAVNKLEYGAYLAAALSYLMVQQRDAVGFTLFNEQIEFSVRPKAKKSWLVPIFRELEQITQTSQHFQHKTATAEVLHQLAPKLGRRGLVVLITDLFSNLSDPYDLLPALQHLRHAKHEVLVFHILEEKTEVNFQFPNRPLIMKDLETGEEIKVHPEQIKDNYTEMLEQYREHFKRRCRELNVDFVEVDINTPYDKLLSDYLVKRARMTR